MSTQSGNVSGLSSGERLLAALGCFGLIVLALQIGWIFSTHPERPARYSVNIVAAIFAFDDLGLSDLVYLVCCALAYLMMSTIASMALALPLSAELRNLQRLLLSALLTLSLAWQLFGLIRYLQGSSSTSTMVLILGSLALSAMVLLRSRSPMNLMQAWVFGVGLATVHLAICILITFPLVSQFSGERDELSQRVLVPLLGLALVGWALRLRSRAAQYNKTSITAALLFQLWLLTIWMPPPGFFADMD